MSQWSYFTSPDGQRGHAALLDSPTFQMPTEGSRVLQVIDLGSVGAGAPDSDEVVQTSVGKLPVHAGSLKALDAALVHAQAELIEKAKPRHTALGKLPVCVNTVDLLSAEVERLRRVLAERMEALGEANSRLCAFEAKLGATAKEKLLALADLARDVAMRLDPEDEA